MKRETRDVICLLGAWLCFALAIGVAGWFRNAGALTVAITVWGLTALALLAWWKIPSVHDWSAMVDLHWLIALHLGRFVGFYFLALGNRGGLPQGFAKPAGIGDISIAIAAALLLLIRQSRRREVLFIWNSLGLIDIVFVAFSALRFGLRDWQSMARLRELPLCLLPTMIVPLIIASHILIFVRLKTKPVTNLFNRPR